MSQDFLRETKVLDFSNVAIQNYVAAHIEAGMSPNEKAVALFYAVRDQFLYNPFYINLSIEDSRASKVIERAYGHCIDKASLLIACYRAAGLPARLGLAKVKNHIATERLEEYLGSKVLTPHGYVEVLLNDRWRKVTPAFNKSLCDKLKVATLEFNGEEDCLFQAYDREGGQFMEYIEDYGTFEDIPLDFIVQNMKDHYPKLKDDLNNKLVIEY